MEIDTIKISELAEGTTINNDSILVYNLNGQTKKITFQNLKNAVISALASEVSQLDADLEAETTARAAADTSLAGDITAEATARTAADTALAGDISAEAAARVAADNNIINTLEDLENNTHKFPISTSDTTIVLPTAYRGILITCDSDSTRCGMWMLFTYSDGVGGRTAMFSSSTGVIVTGTSNGLKVNTNSGGSYGLIIDISKHVTSIS